MMNRTNKNSWFIVIVLILVVSVLHLSSLNCYGLENNNNTSTSTNDESLLSSSSATVDGINTKTNNNVIGTSTNDEASSFITSNDGEAVDDDNNNITNNIVEKEKGNAFQRFFMMILKKKKQMNNIQITTNDNNDDIILDSSSTDKGVDDKDTSETAIETTTKTTTTLSETSSSEKNVQVIDCSCTTVEQELDKRKKELYDETKKFKQQILSLTQDKKQLQQDKIKLQKELKTIQETVRTTAALTTTATSTPTTDECNTRISKIQQQSDTELLYQKQLVLQQEKLILKLKDEHTTAIELLQKRQEQILIDNEIYTKDKINRIQSDLTITQNKLLEFYNQPAIIQNTKLQTELQQLQKLYNTLTKKYETIVEDRTQQLQVYLETNLMERAQNMSYTIIQQMENKHNQTIQNLNTTIQSLHVYIDTYSNETNHTIRTLNNQYITLQETSTKQVQYITNLTNTIAELQESIIELNTNHTKELAQRDSTFNQTLEQHKVAIQALTTKYITEREEYERAAITKINTVNDECQQNVSTIGQQLNNDISKVQYQLNLTQKEKQTIVNQYNQSIRQLQYVQQEYDVLTNSATYWETMYMERSYINMTYIALGVYTSINTSIQSTSNVINEQYTTMKQHRFVQFLYKVYTLTVHHPFVIHYIMPVYNKYISSHVQAISSTIYDVWVPTIQSELNHVFNNGLNEIYSYKVWYTDSIRPTIHNEWNTIVTNGSNDIRTIKEFIQKCIQQIQFIQSQIQTKQRHIYQYIHTSYTSTMCSTTKTTTASSSSNTTSTYWNKFDKFIQNQLPFLSTILQDTCIRTDDFIISIVYSIALFTILLFINPIVSIISVLFRTLFTFVVTGLHIKLSVLRYCFFIIPLRCAVIICTYLLGDVTVISKVQKIDYTTPPKSLAVPTKTTTTTPKNSKTNKDDDDTDTVAPLQAASSSDDTNSCRTSNNSSPISVGTTSTTE